MVLKSFGWTGRVVQVVECLPSKHEALSSNPNTAKTKKSFGLDLVGISISVPTQNTFFSTKKCLYFY
jgi:hypothetical protein